MKLALTILSERLWKGDIQLSTIQYTSEEMTKVTDLLKTKFKK